MFLVNKIHSYGVKFAAECTDNKKYTNESFDFPFSLQCKFVFLFLRENITAAKISLYTVSICLHEVDNTYRFSHSFKFSSLVINFFIKLNYFVLVNKTKHKLVNCVIH